MALDATAITALANAMKAAKIACGAADNPALAVLCLAEANAIATFVKNGEVDTTAATLIAPTGGGPCTGTAPIK